MQLLIIGLFINIFYIASFMFLENQNMQNALPLNPDHIKLQMPEEQDMHRWHLVSTYFLLTYTVLLTLQLMTCHSGEVAYMFLNLKQSHF